MSPDQAITAATGPSERPGRLALDYRLHDDVTIGGESATRHVERWTITVTTENAEPVGYAEVVILNLEGDIEISDLTDVGASRWREPATRTGARGEVAGVLGKHVLVLDRVLIEPDRRGHGLGPIVAALAMERLRRGCAIAVCYPAPFEDTSADADRDAAIVALGRIWGEVGFRPRSDGVWVLDLEGDTLTATTARLLARGPLGRSRG